MPSRRLGAWRLRIGWLSSAAERLSVISSARYMDELAVFFRQFVTRCVSDESLATILTFLSQH